MKIVFTGLPYFGKKLVAELSEFDKKNTYVFCDTYYSLWDRVRFIFHLLSANRVVSLNGVSNKSGSLNWVIRFKRKLILQWQGSDVLTLIENKKNGQFDSKYIDYSISFTDATWLMEELNEVGVSSQILHFKHVSTFENLPKFKTSDVVIYMATSKEKFYGLEHIIDLANKFPNTKFHIIGTAGAGIEVPENILFLGWIDQQKVNELMNNHACYIRLTEHDGYSLSILEAVANGNYIIWNMPHPCVGQVKGDCSLTQQFINIQDQVNVAQLGRNSKAITWAAHNLNKSTVLRHYITTITG